MLIPNRVLADTEAVTSVCERIVGVCKEKDRCGTESRRLWPASACCWFRSDGLWFGGSRGPIMTLVRLVVSSHDVVCPRRDVLGAWDGVTLNRFFEELDESYEELGMKPDL